MRIEDARVRDSREPRHEASASHHRRRRRSRAADTTARITAPAGDCYGVRGTSCASGRRPCGTPAVSPASPRRSRRTCGPRQRARRRSGRTRTPPLTRRRTRSRPGQPVGRRALRGGRRRRRAGKQPRLPAPRRAGPEPHRRARRKLRLRGQHRRDRAVPVHVRLVESGGRQRHYLRRPATRPQRRRSYSGRFTPAADGMFTDAFSAAAATRRAVRPHRDRRRSRPRSRRGP